MTGGRPELAVGAVARAGGALLLVRRAQPPEAGSWSVPGGRVERGETLAEAVVREVAEETGLDVVCGALLGWAERIGIDHHFVVLDFEVVPVEPGGWAAPTPGSDALEAAWVPLPDIAALDLVSGLEAFLRHHGVLPAPPPGVWV